MKVSDILDKKGREVYKVNSNTTVYDAVEEMSKHKIGSLLVVNDDKEIEGIVTERDILFKCHELNTDLHNLSINKISTPKEKIIIGTLNDNTSYLMSTMTKNKIRHIPIVDKDEIVGLISIGDVVKGMLDDSEQEATLLREFVKSPYGVPHV